MRAVFISLFTLCVLVSEAQTIQVIDLFTGLPVSSAHVYTQSEQYGLVTDELGKVEISTLIPFDSLRISHTAYRMYSVTMLDLKKEGYRIYLESKVIQMPAFEITAARERLIDSPQRSSVLTVEEVERTAPATTADLLESSGEVFVQRSQLGGGSPVLRGFEANRILLMIDGVRLNNAIYRSGHLQNAITVDAFTLDNTEILFGPGSLVYGSDALGGVVHFHTKKPSFRKEDESTFKFNLAQRYSTATDELASHFDATISGKRLASWTSFTRSEFGEMTMGENRLHGDDDWGLVPEYIDEVDGEDVVMTNAESSTIPNVGYSQYDLGQKLLFQATDSVSLMLNLQYSTTSDIPRADQLAAYRNGQLRYAEWSYGPQERIMTALQVDFLSDNPAYDKGGIIVAYQKVGEDRITRNFGSQERFVREEDVGVFSLNADLVKRWKSKDLYYGIEATSNSVESQANVENIQNGGSEPGPTRYPDGDSRMSTTSLYMALNGAPSKQLKYNLGLRYGHAYLDSKYNDTTFYSLPFREIRFNSGAPTAAAGISYKPAETWNIGLSTATGFRTPNVDDYGKVFERTGIVVVPTDQLKPEYTINGELRLEKSFNEEKILAEGAAFYTHIMDAIVQRESSLNGMDSMLYEGSIARIAINENAGEAYIYGWTTALSVQISEDLTWTNTATMTIGEVVDSEDKLAHIPPFFARTALQLKKEKWNCGAYVLYNDTKLSKNIGPGRTDNPAQGINGAFPSWYTININGAYFLQDNIVFRLNLDNITDVHYKAFASGISAPGRNISLSLRLSF